MHLGSLAAGDINDDGWPDVAVGTSYGVFLYVNLGGHFELQEIDFPAMRSWRICDVALVDLDGDGQLDLYVSAWMHGSHVLFNRGGEFSAKAHAELPRGGEVCNASTAFADVDRDGLVDIVTGGATFESWYFYPEPAVNRLWHNRGGGKFEPEVLPGPEGDSLSLLFTDLNGDGWPDLLVGNDFDEPDRVYLNEHGQAAGGEGRGVSAAVLGDDHHVLRHRRPGQRRPARAVRRTDRHGADERVAQAARAAGDELLACTPTMADICPLHRAGALSGRGGPGARHLDRGPVQGARATRPSSATAR